jgi:hypothetical protein
MVKRRAAALAVGLLVPLGSFFAYQRLLRPEESFDDKLAAFAGIDPRVFGRLQRMKGRLQHGRDVTDQEWSELLRLTYEPKRELRDEAFDTLGSAYGSPREGQARVEVRRMKSDPYVTIRGNYPFALMRLRSPDWRLAVEEGARDPSEHVRLLSVNALRLAETIHRAQDRWLRERTAARG